MTHPDSIARSFHQARRAAQPLAGFPGELPDTLAEAYAVQEAAIGLWPDQVRGWKVAAIHPDLRARFGSARLSGPVFGRGVYHVATGQVAQVPVIRDGFIAVETEIGVMLASDLPLRAQAWSLAELDPYIAGLHVAMEIAGSPLPIINDLGPCSIISDFGNNTAVAVGAGIAGWREGALAGLRTQMRIDGAVIGEGAAIGVNGGPLDAFVFLVNHLAGRGRSLRGGDVISAGATTGVHPISIGQEAEAICIGIEPLKVRIVERQPF